MTVDYRKNDHPPRLVSIHGGHSADFCTHAQDGLEQLITTYIEKGFSWVGITEHMPPMENKFRYPEEIEAGLSADDLYRRFSCYIRTCRGYQEKYASKIRIAVGLETETYPGALPFVLELIDVFEPDYVVGSVHHVNAAMFDYDQTHYDQASAALGGVDALYHRYFDIQYEMITTIKPAVVGHFDLIRIHDPDYMVRLEKPSIRKKILRNLECIHALGSILDLNMRALYRGGQEPYISRSILNEALKMGIAVVPGDDSHSVSTVGYKIMEGIHLLADMGFDTEWKLPGGG